MKRFSRPRHSTIAAYLALFVALGGTSYAAIKLPRNSVGTKQLKADAVRSAKVKNRSLLAKDFKAGQIPRGERGAQGIQGVRGLRGLAGAPATRLFATVNSSATAMTGTATAASLDSTGRYTVTFNRDVRNCTAIATTGSGPTTGEDIRDAGINAFVGQKWSTPTMSVADNNSVALLMTNTAGETTANERINADFHIAVFC